MMGHNELKAQLNVERMNDIRGRETAIFIYIIIAIHTNE